MSRIAIAIGAVVLAVLIVGALFVVYDDLAAPPIIIADPAPHGTFIVEVVGAVASPGTYEVAAGARIVDVIAAAGGPRPDADLGGVNQARRVRDEDRIVIPSRTQSTETSANVSTDLTTASGEESTLININSASAAELETLPGVGSAIAQRIVDYRDEHGPFRTVDELDNVSGISAAMVDEMRPLISVDE